uniref:OTU domain-containing protein n=1 Tax=Clytia hemisphaerica TaxID=252671 RepID=A0A7M5URB9_9CNID
MRTNEDDFLPFTSNTKTGDILSTEEYGKYCDDIENTTTWGGQLEIRSISNVYQQRVEIYQANAPRLVIGEEHVASTPLRLSYTIEDVSVCNQDLCVFAKMGTGHKATAKIRVFPTREEDAATKIKEKLQHDSFGNQEYDNFLEDEKDSSNRTSRAAYLQLYSS